MSRRRSKGEPELPLFDLPLHGEGDASSAGSSAGTAAGATTGTAELPAPPGPVAPAPTNLATETAPAAPPGEPGLLFDPDELEPPSPHPGPERASADGAYPEGAAVGGELLGPSDGIPAPVQDRILGGLADLTVHVATLGAIVILVQLMGVPVARDDIPAFATLGLVFSFLYTIIPLAFWGQTPGMSWVGHTSRSVEGEPLTFGQTFLRWLGVLFTVALLGLPVLLAFGGRSLCDRLSDSRTLQL